MRTSPEDFASEQPPVRPIGVECEYNLQLPDNAGYSYGKFVDSSLMSLNGIANHYGFLGSAHGSGRVYPDVGHIEFDTAEANGPASAALEDIRGIDRISDIISTVGLPHTGLYRLAGTYIPFGRVNDSPNRSSTGKTSGYHENFLAPRHITEPGLFDKLLPTGLATRLWAMAGTLRPTGYVFSQKVWGIGGTPVERTLTRQTHHGNKPMIIIRDNDGEDGTIGDGDWARVEVRYAEPGLSLVNRYLSFAFISLSLRLIEQRHRLDERQLEGLCLVNPVSAAKYYAGDLALRVTARNYDDQTVTALDTQEAMIEQMERLDELIELPTDEHLAIPQLRSQIEALRSSSPNNAHYTTVARMRMDIAPKHQYIETARDARRGIKSSVKPAMQRNLVWSRVLPDGPGQRYWQQMSKLDPLAAQVQQLGTDAGLTPRAIRRSKMIDNNGWDGIVCDWATYTKDDVYYFSLGSPI